MHENQQYGNWADDLAVRISSDKSDRILNVYPDIPDYRDYRYRPGLTRTPTRLEPRYSQLLVLDQGEEGACSGFGLAAAVNLIKFRDLKKTPGSREGVSARMLYELARKHDEWPGAQYVGSSCRGAIKGWYTMGVCSEQDYPYVAGEPGVLTVARAREARKNRIGAYYRVNHRLADFHAAINEAGAIFASASIHPGWTRPKASNKRSLPKIIRQHQKWDKPGPRPGHAFCIVGYTDSGFIVQNSWGADWGRAGFAIWAYEDWFENIRDAWIFSLSLSTPSIWQVSTRLRSGSDGFGTEQTSSKPVRSEIAGHFTHIDDGQFHDHGAYASNLEDVRQTADYLAGSTKDTVRHLLFYAHGGLTTLHDSAMRIRVHKNSCLEKGIYPYHFMCDTALMEDARELVQQKMQTIAGQQGWSAGDTSDSMIEKSLRYIGRSIWREMKYGKRQAFAPGGAGSQVLEALLGGVQETRPDLKIHLLGHSTGAILLAHLLQSMARQFPELRVSTVSLMVPAASTQLFREFYVPFLSAPGDSFGIDAMTIYNLNKQQEKDDEVFKIYRKSLLYLISRSFEEELGGDQREDTEKQRFGARLLGMQRYSVPVDRRAGKKVEFLYSGSARAKERTTARRHVDFDTDMLTMKDIYRRILSQA